MSLKRRVFGGNNPEPSSDNQLMDVGRLLVEFARNNARESLTRSSTPHSSGGSKAKSSPKRKNLLSAD